MKNLLFLVSTAALAWILTMFIPWWGIMIAAIVTSYFMAPKNSLAFWIPFVAIGLLWGLQAFFLSEPNDFIMAERIARLFPLEGNVTLLILVTSVTGAIAAGFSGLLGRALSKGTK